MHKKIIYVIMLLLALTGNCFAQASLTIDGAFPYRIEGDSSSIAAGSSNLCYIVLTSTNSEQQQAQVKIVLPAGIDIIKQGEWTRISGDNQVILTREIILPANYGQWVDFVDLKAAGGMENGSCAISIEARTADRSLTKNLVFTIRVLTEQTGNNDKTGLQSDWNISRVVLPVDKEGLQDERIAQNVLYITDGSSENLRKNLVGRGVTNWAALEKHPVGHALVVIDNNKQDTKLLQLRAELIDTATGGVVAGFQSAGDLTDAEQCDEASDNASKILVALNGNQIESFVLPLYANAGLKSGIYNMRIEANGIDKQSEMIVPVSIVAKRNQTGYVIAVTILAIALFIVMFTKNIKKWLKNLEARGVITIALFASVAFGSISIPTTLAGDFLKLFLGPFTGLVTGLLSGTLLYLLITALFTLYPQRGTIALMIFLKWLLGALLFGRITPIGFAICCTQIAALESVLVIWQKLTDTKAEWAGRLVLAFLFGISDAALTYINMELMMFFYRLYYADWYIWLHVIVCGFIYTVIGTHFGYRLGYKLQQVLGE